MNTVVRHYYPAANLPEDLRAGLADGEVVTVTIQREEGADPDRLRRLLDEAQARGVGTGITQPEAVARIRALRDEWIT